MVNSKKWITNTSFFVLSLALLFTPLFTLFSSTANAADGDQYLNSYEHVSTAIVQHKGLSNCSDPQNLSQNWSSYITDSTKWQNESDSSKAQHEAYSSAFKNSLDTGSWSVSTVWDGNNSSHLDIYFSQTHKIKLNWYPSPTYNANATYLQPSDVSGDLYHVVIACDLLTNAPNGQIETGYLDGMSGSNPTTSTGGYITFNNQSDDTQSTKNFLFTGDPNYPPGYTGIPVNSTYIPPISHSPIFTWDVQRKHLNLTFQPTDIIDTSSYAYCFSLVQDETGKTLDQLHHVKDACVTPYGNYSLDVPTLQTYTLGVGIYPSAILANPDANLPPLPNTSMKWIDLHMDGSFFTGSTNDPDTQQNCVSTTVGGIPVSRCDGQLLQVCTYNSLSDLIKFTSCEINNLSIAFISSLRALFIPDYYYLNNLFSQTQSNINTKLGVLLYPLGFITGVFQAFTTAVQAQTTPCSSISPNNSAHALDISGTFFGGSFSPNFCDFPNKLPQLWNIIVIIIQVVTIFGLVAAYYAAFLKVFSGGRDGYMSDARGDIVW